MTAPMQRWWRFCCSDVGGGGVDDDDNEADVTGICGDVFYNCGCEFPGWDDDGGSAAMKTTMVLAAAMAMMVTIRILMTPITETVVAVT